MKKFLVLGIGNAQVDLYRKLQGSFEVHGLSNTNIGRGYKYCDHFECIDITDYNQVLEYSKQNQIDYIYSVGSDVAMPTVAYVSEKLNLPHFVNYEVAKTCNNKALFRDVLRGVYGAVPFQVESDLPESLDVDFPMIVKPVDSQGQRGVSTAHNKHELIKSFSFAKKHSRCGDVILERKVNGEEISVNAYVIDGELIFFLPSDRESWNDYDGGIIRKHILPVTINEPAIKNVERLVRETIHAIGITNGPVYFQIKMEKDNPFLIEVTPRFDGCHMWNLIKFSTDIDLLSICIDHLLSKKLNKLPIYTVNPSALEFICQAPGEIVSKYNADACSLYQEHYYLVGEVVNEMNGIMEKCGYKINLVD